MKILILTESCPFPPTNGKELPIAKIFEELSEEHKVDIIISENIQNKDEAVHKCKEAGMAKITFIQKNRLSKRQRVLNSIFKLDFASLQPFIFNSKDFEAAIGDEVYDWVWVSPISSFSLVESTHKKFYHHLALGLNDVKTYLYKDSLNEVIKSGIWDNSKIFHYLRSFSMKSQERKILKKCDLVHVQTAREKNKVLKILNDKTSINPAIIVSPNGINPDSCNSLYEGIDSNSVLMVTQLLKGRRNESKWFIKKVWPQVIKACPEAKLHLVGKTPERLPEYIKSCSNIYIEGFVPSLKEFSKNMTISVVPTFHGTGLINRILDSFCSSLPTVTTKAAAATFHDVIRDEHLFTADKPKEFASKIILLLTNRELRKKISSAGNEYAKKFPQWKHGVKKIEQTMIYKTYSET